ncbi:type II toxin-antitoxin system ParD family antitoxin [Vibrio lentus]|uniref:type II toxin-antitoxin system ParD family antitoxin n=1 Tax=Vibrio lentus TaxID=136468 RepID=UPI00101AE7AB|nr:type II toxin-antitoxin system ParD family antitoxin [Vibrio lentus]MCB5362068.1 hypothetical protein [Vibrio lentus]MCB5452234.1 hypothetical protein [Vibrio lentus]MCB5464437.1 hypothetical protein [Vibrio lentus]MCC4795073.1 type II toxin-antitoxin system ParD family antitoxin [Vibrio lentus]MCC4815290.1 type II toxin-antitoxin system ParD family antitoxin [Vibrio lentus]
MATRRSDSPIRFQRLIDLKENEIKTLRQRLMEGESSGIANYHFDALIKALEQERDKSPPEQLA